MMIYKRKDATKTTYSSGDKVFCKLKGYRAWPAKIKSLVHNKRKKVNYSVKKYNVVFYGTNETAIVETKNIFPYFPYRDKFGSKCEYKKFNDSMIAAENDIKPKELARLDLVNSNKVKNKTERRVKNNKHNSKLTVPDTLSPKKYRKKVKKKGVDLQPTKLPLIACCKVLDKIPVRKKGGKTHVVEILEEFPKEYLKIDQKSFKDHFKIDQESHEQNFKIDQKLHTQNFKTDKKLHEKIFKIDQKLHEQNFKIDEKSHGEYFKIDEGSYEEYFKIDQEYFDEHLKIDQEYSDENLKIDQEYPDEHFKIYQEYPDEHFKIDQKYSKEDFKMDQEYSEENFKIDQEYSEKNFKIDQEYSEENFKIDQEYSEENFKIDQEYSEENFKIDQEYPEKYYKSYNEIAIKQEANYKDDAAEEFSIMSKVQNNLINSKNIFLIEFEKSSINSSLDEYDKSSIDTPFVKYDNDFINTFVKYDEDILNTTIECDQDTIKTLLLNYGIQSYEEGKWNNFIYAGKDPKIVKIPLNLNMPIFTYMKYANGWDKLVLDQANLLKKMVEKYDFTEGIYELMDNFTKTLAEVFNQAQDKQLNEWIFNIGCMLEANVNIRECLNLVSPNPQKCIKYIDILDSISIDRLMLKKYPDVVHTIHKVKKFKGNVKNRHYDKKEFNKASKLLREKAQNLYNKFKKLFLIPKQKSFWNYFLTEVEIFNKRVEGLSPDKIFMIVEETD